MRKPIPEIVQKGQGKRLQEFMVAQGVKSRSEFARIVGVSSSSINEVVWGHKEIKANLLFKMAHVFRNLDTEWLLTGKKSEFSTIKPDIVISDIVEESQKDYNTLHKLLEEKERYILSLEDRVASQKQAIFNLQKELDECKKREAHTLHLRLNVMHLS